MKHNVGSVVLACTAAFAVAAACVGSEAGASKGDAEAFPPAGFRFSDDAFEASFWGRTYSYRESAFPASVRIAGREVFNAPMSLHAKFGETEGVFRDWKYTLFSSNADAVVVLASAHCSNVIVNAAITFERDGMARTDLKLVPYGYYSLEKIRDYEPDLSAFWVEIDMKGDSSGLFHFWPNSDNSIVPAQDVLNSGATVSRELPFKAWTWCGWEDGGFGVACESAAAFELDDERRCISVSRSDASTRIRYRLLDRMPAAWRGRRDRWDAPLMPVEWTFAVQATPVKPRPVGDVGVYRRLHIYDVPGTRILETGVPERFGRAGVKYAVLHSTFSRAEGFGVIGDKREFREIVDRFHRNGVKVLVYYGFEFPTIMPSWNEKRAEYLIEDAKGRNVGGWQATTHRAYQSCYKSEWAGEVARNACAVVDEFGLDGIYTDGMYIPWECANARHGCGWADSSGRRHTTFPIFAVRDLVRRLHREMRARGCTIEAHQSACMVAPLLSFADTCFDGENIQATLAKNPEFLSTDAFRCEYSGYAFGLPMTFIAYTNDKLTIEMLEAITLVHNVHPVPRELSDLDFVSRVWRIFEERSLDSAEFVPYWRERLCDVPGVYASSYRDGHRTTVVASNLSSADKTVPLPVPPGVRQVRDLLSGETFAPVGGKVEFVARPFRPRILAMDR